MSTSGAIAADNLCGLLALHVQACNLMEEHNRKVITDGYKTLDLERKAYKHIQEKYQQPIMSKCTWFGFKYSDLLEIIPPAFETNFIQRRDILKDLREFSEKEFGEYVIPF